MRCMPVRCRINFRLGKYYHLANLVADEYGADAVRITRPQMRRYYFASCHCTYLKIVIVITFLKSFDHC